MYNMTSESLAFRGKYVFLFCLFLFFLKIYFIDYAITVVPLSPFIPSAWLTPSHLHSPPLVHVHVSYISSLASTFPILFLTSFCIFSTYHLCCLFPVPFLPFSPSPTDNPPCDLHFCDSVPVLVVCLVCFCLCFMFGC